MPENKESTGWIFAFATMVCAGMATLLASTYNGLREGIEANQAYDRQLNILTATGLYDPSEPKPRKEMEAVYRDRIEEMVLEVAADGAVSKTAMKPAELAAMRDPRQRAKYLEFYVAKDPAGAVKAYCMPISGKGLWSTLYGFLALQPDLDHVQGITFYKHGETPGLGAEVENPKWQAQWHGKEILADDGSLRSITVKKGTVDANMPVEKRHYVDGLSGATITSNGVTKFVASDLAKYEPWFKTLRKS